MQLVKNETLFSFSRARTLHSVHVPPLPRVVLQHAVLCLHHLRPPERLRVVIFISIVLFLGKKISFNLIIKEASITAAAFFFLASVS